MPAERELNKDMHFVFAVSGGKVSFDHYNTLLDTVCQLDLSETDKETVCDRIDVLLKSMV